MVHAIERRFGVRHVLHVDNLFGSGHVLQQPTQGMSFVVVAVPPQELATARSAAEEIARGGGLDPRSVEVPADDNPHDARQILKAILGIAGELA